VNKTAEAVGVTNRAMGIFPSSWGGVDAERPGWSLTTHMACERPPRLRR